ncbi:DUF6777 domain-containing protein [Streptomyces sp. Wb2n-11]|uniref:DUF6777 domain-containing protein n=1 Tax=Streptomyces sp. Wb2n-11 TaxID=1030533 RepID=UPI000A5A88DA|nr:DUF6777 domain-containing protein [Streptomyces sp. Wb2n-11]
MPRVSAVAAVLVTAVVVTVALTRPDGGPATGGEIFLETAGSSGPDPYTESAAREDPGATSSATPPDVGPSTSVARSHAVPVMEGSGPGLYGGTRKVSSCDVEKQITTLMAEQSKNKAFATVLEIEPTGVPDHLRSLTPVRLRMDTRVTSHGYRSGAPTRYQAVLQAGTAVLVDDRGVPRVRCACGNPLLPPDTLQGTVRRTGTPWPGFRPTNVVTVKPAARPVDAFVMFDPGSEGWFRREAGDTGDDDEEIPPPATGTPTSSPPPGASPSPPSDAPPSVPPEPGSHAPDPPSEPAPDSPGPQSPDPPAPGPPSADSGPPVSKGPTG